MDEPTVLLTTAEAARELGVTPGRIRQLILDGTLPSVKRGRDRFVARGAVDEARDRQTRTGPRVTTGAGLRRRRKSLDTAPELPPPTP